MSEKIAILYVDDDDDIRGIVEMSLALDPAIDVRVAASGMDALALLAKGDWRPDGIVLDVMMPGMDGPMLMDNIRTQPALASVPVVFMTAKGQDADVARFRARGAVDIIVKPFDPLTLAQRVRAILASAKGL